MKFDILLLVVLLFSFSCTQKKIKTDFFLTKILASNSSIEGEYHLTLDGTGEARNSLFQVVKIESFKESFREYAKYKDVLKIDISIGSEKEVSYFPFTELTKMLNEIKGMAEEYNCKTIVYIHSDRIK